MEIQRPKKEQRNKQEIEGERIYKRKLLLHDFDQGQPSAIIFGQPGSCKTAILCQIVDEFKERHPEDRIFWRSALNAPLQIVKLSKWHIFVEKHSGVRFFDRRTGLDVTDRLYRRKKLTYFTTFAELYRKALPGVCNGVFFKDLHIKNIKYDQGTLQWFRFLRFLLLQFEWCHVFFDEYQEMVKFGSGDRMWWEIDKHGNDVSSARKTHVGIYADCHQTAELDPRIPPNFMIVIQLFGSRLYRHNSVTKRALAALKEPDERYGAEAWMSEGGKFGKILFPKVYKLKTVDIAPRIISEYEHTKTCESCQRAFVYTRKDQVYCNNACATRAFRKRKREKREPMRRNKDKAKHSVPHPS